MGKFLDNNSLSKIPTRFLRGVELVQRGLEEYKLYSENWAQPWISFGYHQDGYYGEIWFNGMDWQNNYWLIESVDYSNPKCYPIIVFKDYKDEFSEMKELFLDIMWDRRNKLWLKRHHDKDLFTFYIHKVEPAEKFSDTEGGPSDCLIKYYIEHASQKRKEFWLNEGLLLKDIKIPNPEPIPEHWKNNKIQVSVSSTPLEEKQSV